jgi:hypothetical protein
MSRKPIEDGELGHGMSWSRQVVLGQGLSAQDFSGENGELALP